MKQKQFKELMVVAMRSLSQPLGHVLVGQLDLSIRWTRVGEFVAAVGVVEVTPHTLEFGRDVVLPVLLCNHLRVNLNKKERKKERTTLFYKPDLPKCKICLCLKW